MTTTLPQHILRAEGLAKELPRPSGVVFKDAFAVLKHRFSRVGPSFLQARLFERPVLMEAQFGQAVFHLRCVHE